MEVFVNSRLLHSLLGLSVFRSLSRGSWTLVGRTGRSTSDSAEELFLGSSWLSIPEKRHFSGSGVLFWLAAGCS